MTRKDYILIAAALREPLQAFDDPAQTHAALCVWEETARNIARALGRDNPRFDGDRFLKAAGVEV